MVKTALRLSEHLTTAALRGETRRIIYYVVASALVLLLTLRAPRSAAAQNQLLPARAGVVTRVDGEVWYRSSGGADLQRLRLGARLSAGDRVLTGEMDEATA